MAPVRCAAFATGAVIGTPIAITRKVFEESVDATKTVAHGKDNPFVYAAASVVGIPVGIIAGTIEGVYYGPANAYNNSSEHPFGLDSFSLGDMGEK